MLKVRKPAGSSSFRVLQYLKNPYQIITELQNYNFKHIIVDRTTFIENGGDLLTIQRVPKEIYDASLPAWIFNKNKFIKYFNKNYSMISEFDAIDGAIRCREINAYYEGLIFDRKS